MKSIYTTTSATVGVGFFSLLFTAISLWLLDIVGLDVWIAHRIGYFISLVAERV